MKIKMSRNAAPMAMPAMAPVARLEVELGVLPEEDEALELVVMEGLV